jgi:hypothetical protein
MKYFNLIILLTIFSAGVFAQNNDSTLYSPADRILESDGKLKIGGYAEAHYNQRIDSDNNYNGKIDVHRVIMLFGYQFDQKTQFITELEFEHVKEVYVEQAFLQYEINRYINFRAGLLLIPMGLINEYHEPTTFHGVERPLIDKYIAPTTWRELGFGLSGKIIQANLRYQLYLVNGFNSFDGSAKLNGASAFRSARQKGAESFMSSPNFTSKIEYFGLRNLNFGFSTYLGKTQSTLYDGIQKDDNQAYALADSSVVSIAMIGLDARYNFYGVQLRGQYYFASISNTEQYNYFTSNAGTPNDLANKIGGFYVEAAYNVFKHSDKLKSELTPFVRYQKYDTHQSVDSYLAKNENYNMEIITSGISWAPTNGSVLKADIQLMRNANNTTFIKTLNFGFGVMF